MSGRPLGEIELPDGALAVIGMDARLPGAASVAQFWENLCAGREGVRFFEPGEIDPAVPAAERLDPNYVRAKGVIDDCDKFDASFFDISPLEAQLMDPQQRIMLELAWSALENAGHAPSAFPGMVGVYLGMNWNRYRSTCIAAHPEVAARFGEFNTALGNEYDFLATRISYKLNLRGPSVSIATACSTSLVTIAQACQSLLNFDCDIALAGGISVSVPVNAGYLYLEGGMLSADGHCRAFDANGTGTTFNDGAGVVVLRRLADAVADGDHIHAVVRGFALNNDGGEKASFTAPSVSGQEAVIRSALEYANIDPATVGYVEAHGTATPLGDPIEVTALKRVFADAHARGARCALGSVKSSIGHVIHAAGVAGFIKAVIAVRAGKLPPNLFFDTPNPRLDLDDSPFYVNTKLEEWVTASHPRRAGVSSFGVGGTNAHVVLEQPPVLEDRQDSGSARVLCLSAKNEDALDRQVAALQRFLSTHPDAPSLDSVADTLQRGRASLPHRAAVAVRSIADAAAGLGDKRRVMRARVTSSPATAFMFTGQGAQRAGMGRWLYANNAAFSQCFDEGAELLFRRTGLDIRALLFSSSAQAERDVDETRFTQPALFLLEYSLARVLEGQGLSPTVLFGHSIGEFVAATLAGVFSYDDALYVVAKRGEAMQSMPRGSMLVVHCGEAEAQRHLSSEVSLAALNAPELSVLSGPDAAIEAIERALASAGLRHKRLRTSHAFHSAMMEPAAEALASVLAGITLSAPRRTVISTATGRVLTAAEARDPSYWSRQLRSTVRFSAALDTLADAGECVLLEVGPGSSLTTLALQHERAGRWTAQATLPGSGLDESAGLELLTAVAQCWSRGAAVDWKRQWSGASPRRVELPTYQFARTRYWLDQPAHSAEAAAVRAQEAASAYSTPATQEPIALSESDRRDGLERRVIKVLEETSGYDLTDAGKDATLTELGFDSLLLTQVSTALKREFAVAVTFRSLLEDCGSIRELTDRLVRDIPASVAIAPTVPDGPAGKGTEREREPQAPGPRIEHRPAARQLTRSQQAFVDALIDSYTTSTAASKALTQRHRKHLADPRTVSGFNPLWKEMVYPIVTNRSKGSRVWDLDGREYVDFTNGFDSIFFGHSPDFVAKAVLEQIAEGIETGPQSPLAGEVAELFCDLTGNERAAFANTGSEAVQAALRLARTVTSREKVVMFDGADHGVFDEVVVRAGRNGVGLPASAGVPRAHTSNIVVLPYGTDESLARIREMGPELAAVIVETIPAHHPGPHPVAFLKALRKATEEAGIALIFDEVLSGLRSHPGGVQSLFDIRADLATYGTLVAGGYPIGIVAGKARFMDAIDGGSWQYGDESIPEVGVTFLTGTFVGHPVALAAARVVLQQLKAEGPALQARLTERTASLARELNDFFAAISVQVSLETFSSCFELSVGPDQPFGSLLFYLLRQYGIHAWEFRPCFLTTSHTDEDIAAYKNAVVRAVSELVRHGLLQGDAVALERRKNAAANAPPVEGARLGKDAGGASAWFVPDPDRPGKYLQVKRQLDS